MSDQNCAVCDKEIHSITTRRVGQEACCIDCGDPILETIKNINDNMVKYIIAEHKLGNTVMRALENVKAATLAFVGEKVY